jgi:hypothetical protein
MLKQCPLVLVAAALLSVAVPFAAAQDGPFNDQQSPPYAGRRTAELTKQLKLTSDQQAKVHYALQSEHYQLENLRQDTSLSLRDRHFKIMEIHKRAETQIRGLLDSNQQEKWDDMQVKRKQWMQKHPE